MSAELSREEKKELAKLKEEILDDKAGKEEGQEKEEDTGKASGENEGDQQQEQGEDLAEVSQQRMNRIRRYTFLHLQETFVLTA